MGLNDASGPRYPLRIEHEDGNYVILDSPVEAAMTLEWFDSDDSDYGARVVDALGRPVRVVVVAHELQVCELSDEPSA